MFRPFRTKRNGIDNLAPSLPEKTQKININHHKPQNIPKSLKKINQILKIKTKSDQPFLLILKEKSLPLNFPWFFDTKLGHFGSKS
jgi:hypothetical protein